MHGNTNGGRREWAGGMLGREGKLILEGERINKRKMMLSKLPPGGAGQSGHNAA